MKKRGCLWLLLVLTLASSASAQKSAAGSWTWESRPDKNGVQNTVWLDIKQTGNKVRGVISVMFYDPNGEDGSDAPIAPFVGTVSGDVISIEFDAEDISPLDGSAYPKYVRRKGGAPNTATLRWVGGKLEFTQTKGSIGTGYPRKLTLSRDKRR